MRPSLSLVTLLLAIATSSCSAFRFEVGIGTGVGVGVKIPYLYNGGLLIPTAEVRMGHNYAEGWHSGHGGEPPEQHHPVDYDIALILAATEARSTGWGVGASGWGDPFLLGQHEPEVAGVMSTFSLIPYGWAETYPSTHALEINLHLFLSFHIGWNPYYWYTRAEERSWKIRPTLRGAGVKSDADVK